MKLNNLNFQLIRIFKNKEVIEILNKRYLEISKVLDFYYDKSNDITKKIIINEIVHFRSNIENYRSIFLINDGIFMVQNNKISIILINDDINKDLNSKILKKNNSFKIDNIEMDKYIEKILKNKTYVVYSDKDDIIEIKDSIISNIFEISNPVYLKMIKLYESLVSIMIKNKSMKWDDYNNFISNFYSDNSMIKEISNIYIDKEAEIWLTTNLNLLKQTSYTHISPNKILQSIHDNDSSIKYIINIYNDKIVLKSKVIDFVEEELNLILKDVRKKVKIFNNRKFYLKSININNSTYLISDYSSTKDIFNILKKLEHGDWTLVYKFKK